MARSSSVHGVDMAERIGITAQVWSHRNHENLSPKTNIGVGQEWQNTIPEGLTSIHLELGD